MDGRMILRQNDYHVQQFVLRPGLSKAESLQFLHPEVSFFARFASFHQAWLLPENIRDKKSGENQDLWNIDVFFVV